MVFVMIRIFCALFLTSMGLLHAQDDGLREDLESTYQTWRLSIQTKNDVIWRKVTAAHRQIAVKNRLLSEKRKFPQGVFDLPALPPSIVGLKHLDIQRRGPTAKSYYFGKIDFGIGGVPAENLLVLSFTGALGSWKYDQMEYINLAALPEIKAQLTKGDISYISKSPNLMPSGIVPPIPVAIKEAPYIAKAYAYCPGREIQVQINQTSRHTFQDAQEAQLIIGGAREGINQIQYATKNLIDQDVKDPMTLRVYLMSEVAGVKPIKIFEYQVVEGQKPVAFGKGTFVVCDAVCSQLMGR